MSPFARLDLAGPRPRSLLWQGDHLVDWAGGGRRYFLDGRISDFAFLMNFPFDAAVGTQDVTSDPFHIERAYLRGASDAVGFAFEGRVDWWDLRITGADGQVGPTRRVLRWYERATRRGRVVAGFQDGS